jgi:mxaA protein
MRARPSRLLPALWCLTAAPFGVAIPAAAQIRSVALQPPDRSFGLLAGDTFSAVAIIEAGPDTHIDQGSLPPPGPLAASLDVRSTTVTRTRTRTGQRYAIRITYQTFLAPEQVMETAVPGYSVGFTDHGARSTASVPGFGISVTTFRHDVAPMLDQAAMRPDHAPILADPAQPAWRLLAGVIAALLGIAGLLTSRGWIKFSARDRPFATAARHIARLPPQASSGRDALQSLHRAFDITAGRRVLADDLDTFLIEHPRFLPLRREIAAFFAVSRATFFGGAPCAVAPSLHQLLRGLARAERRP